MPLDDTNWSAPAPDTQTDETTELLIRARSLLKRGWCRGTAAQTSFGLPVSLYSRWAVAWCASGALKAARTGTSDLDYRRASIRLIAAIGGVNIADFNDRQETVEPVLAAFDRAIAAGGR
jgi:hypothetical protein